MPKDIENYIDFDSPILKHLIEIEKKYWVSEVNKNFKLPRNCSSDSESSIKSLQKTTTYDLSSQNLKTIPCEDIKKKRDEKKRRGISTVHANNLEKSAESWKKKPRGSDNGSADSSSKGRVYMRVKKRIMDQSKSKSKSHSRSHQNYAHTLISSKSPTRKKKSLKSVYKHQARKTLNSGTSTRSPKQLRTNLLAKSRKTPSREMSRLKASTKKKRPLNASTIRPHKLDSKLLKSYLKIDPNNLIDRNGNSKSILKQFKDVFLKRRQDLTKLSQTGSSKKQPTGKSQKPLRGSKTATGQGIKKKPNIAISTANLPISKKLKRVDSEFLAKQKQTVMSKRSVRAITPNSNDAKIARPIGKFSTYSSILNHPKSVKRSTSRGSESGDSADRSERMKVVKQIKIAEIEKKIFTGGFKNKFMRQVFAKRQTGIKMTH